MQALLRQKVSLTTTFISNERDCCLRASQHLSSQAHSKININHILSLMQTFIIYTDQVRMDRFILLHQISIYKKEKLFYNSYFNYNWLQYYQNSLKVLPPYCIRKVSFGCFGKHKADFSFLPPLYTNISIILVYSCCRGTSATQYCFVLLYRESVEGFS